MTDSRLKLFISHGDKGGTGKSMAAAIALDHSLVTGTPVLLVEGDAGIPDLALRFRGGRCPWPTWLKAGAYRGAAPPTPFHRPRR